MFPAAGKFHGKFVLNLGVLYLVLYMPVTA